MSRVKHSDEIKLVSQCLKGKRVAQQKLYDTYKVQMFRLCLRYSNSTEDAEDVLQLGFVKVYKSLKKWNADSELYFWMRTIMIRTAVQQIKRKTNWIKEEELGLAAEFSDKELSALDQLQTQDLLALISRLPVGYMTVFNLHAIDGYKHKEIAEMLNINVSTSKSQYLRARMHLKIFISKQDEFEKRKAISKQIINS